MVRKKVDNRIRVLIENGVALNQRTMFVIVGDRGKDQVVILHHMLTKAAVKARPSVLWCYKKELGFSTNRKKRMKHLQKRISKGTLDVNEDDPFELFVAATNVRYCYYNETHKILGSTYGMCVLQDFEALTPNLLARTIETVQGGGVICILLRSMKSLKQLYTMTMDVHSRFRTESHQDVVGRFNERFLLSLSSCKHSLVIDDQLKILPISSHALNISAIPPKPAEEAITPREKELIDLKESLQDTQPIGAIVNCCKTMDQGKALLKFIDVLSEKTLRATVVMTAARGRGKSATLGLALASAVAFGYTNIFVTSPSPENLKTLFEFVFKGFDVLEYQEHIDYNLVQSKNEALHKAIVQVNIFRQHNQTIRYVHPTETAKLAVADVLAIDEAAAIPLPVVQKLLGPYLVFMSSTVNGYEGTGRSLSLKLVQQLRQQSATNAGATDSNLTKSPLGRSLYEMTLEESIRYAPQDPVENWLSNLLCLNCTSASPLGPIAGGCPVPDACELYYVNRDTLFCYHKASEAFLQKLMSLYVASHYKNSPNDLQMLSDAPAHHIFCLLPPVKTDQQNIPDVLCVLQVCFEGEISKESISASLRRGKRASGDLIPWTISEQYQDSQFGSLSGIRVVRIATHPNYQSMGYGAKALALLQKYFEGEIYDISESTGPSDEPTINRVTDEDVSLLDEVIVPRKNLPPLLLKLTERRPERLDYIGVSYGMTGPLLKFWSKQGFIPLYLRQTANDLTGEHSCIMLKVLSHQHSIDAYGAVDPKVDWIGSYYKDFERRFVSLLTKSFKIFKTSVALQVLHRKGTELQHLRKDFAALTKSELDIYFLPHDLKRLDIYSKNMSDYHLITDQLPILSRLFFLRKIEVSLSVAQKAILLGMGLQDKSVDDLAKELSLPSSQILGLFNRTVRKITRFLDEIVSKDVEKSLEGKLKPDSAVDEVDMKPVEESLDDELDEAANEVNKKHATQIKSALDDWDLSQYEIGGSKEDWEKALSKGKKLNMISIKSGEKRAAEEDGDSNVNSDIQKVKKKKKSLDKHSKKFKSKSKRPANK